MTREQLIKIDGLVRRVLAKHGMRHRYGCLTVRNGKVVVRLFVFGTPFSERRYAEPLFNDLVRATGQDIILTGDINPLNALRASGIPKLPEGVRWLAAAGYLLPASVRQRQLGEWFDHAESVRELGGDPARATRSILLRSVIPIAIGVRVRAVGRRVARSQ